MSLFLIVEALLCMLFTHSSECYYRSRAGSRRHRFVSALSKETDQHFRREEFSTSGFSASISVSHSLPHLESFPVLLHCTTHCGPPAGVLQPDH